MSQEHTTQNSELKTQHALAKPELLAGEQLPPAPRQERSRRKRDALLQAAQELFAERGYEETSIEAIAHRAGAAVGGFYQHFASKRQILLVLMEQLLTEASALLGQAQDAPAPADTRSLIEQLVRQGLQTDWAFAGAYRAWLEACARDRELRALNQQIEAWTAGLLEHMFRMLSGLPGARQDADLPTLAWALSLLFWRLAELPIAQPERVDAVVASLTHLIYHALFIDQDA
ncbi:MAG TPA: TetR/AcrR family transcriptional regulator [Roseiflexaceae bacterium]|nr:TetR/AcrR family transcriptional regulator [Roseiflexaceae bacterium]